jgi:hypothetical protein
MALTSREEKELKAFDSRMLRGMLRPKMDEVTGDWRQIHNK